jgi:hypothetical protein
MLFGFSDSLQQTKRYIMASAIVFMVCSVLFTVLMPLATLYSGATQTTRPLPEIGLFRDTNLTVPPSNTYGGIFPEYESSMDFWLTNGWSNPLAGINNDWTKDPKFVLTIKRCLSRALAANNLSNAHFRLSLCYSVRGEKQIDIRKYHHDEENGNLVPYADGVLFNQTAANSMCSMLGWVNEWYARNDTDFWQMMRKSKYLPYGLRVSSTPVTTDDVARVANRSRSQQEIEEGISLRINTSDDIATVTGPRGDQNSGRVTEVVEDSAITFPED